MPRVLPVLAAAVCFVLAQGESPRLGGVSWQLLERGLELAAFPPPAGATGEGSIQVLRVDPLRYELRLLMASALPGTPRRTVRQWCERFACVAGINASMFQEDLLTSVSLMKDRRHVNNPRLTGHRAVLVFDRLDPSVPPVQIVDRDQQPYADLARHYGSHVQSIRMMALDGRNVWERQDQRYSIAAIAVDRGGRVLLIHCGPALAPHDFVEALRALPLDVRNAMYLEGGPTAQMYVGAGGKTVEYTGSFEPGFLAEGDPAGPVPVPNVIGVARRTP